MTTLRSTLRDASYVRALRRVVGQPGEVSGPVVRSLSQQVPPPAGWTEADWFDTIGAYRLAYQVAASEGRDEVHQEILDAIPDAGPEFDFWLTSLLAENPEADARATGVRLRDRILPNLSSVWTAVDLRIVEDEDPDSFSNEVRAAPVVLIRLEFDEHVAGQDAITFQMPVASLDVLTSAFNDARRQVAAMGRQVKVELPDWAVSEPDTEA